MARPRAAAYDQHRHTILREAAALFAINGYSSTTMNEVAQACGVSKAALYHYVRDKSELLLSISMEHVARLEDLAERTLQEPGTPRHKLENLILRFVQEYAGARHEHRVLTEDIKFLEEADQRRVVQAQKRVVDAFASLVAELRPELVNAGLHKALTMLLFGMINWMFTWLRPEGPISHERIGPMVCELFFGGLQAVQAAPAESDQLSALSTTGDKR